MGPPIQRSRLPSFWRTTPSRSPAAYFTSVPTLSGGESIQPEKLLPENFPKWQQKKRALLPRWRFNGTLQPLPPPSPSLSAEISFDISQSQIQSFIFEFDVSGIEIYLLPCSDFDPVLCDMICSMQGFCEIWKGFSLF